MKIVVLALVALLVALVVTPPVEASDPLTAGLVMFVVLPVLAATGPCSAMDQPLWGSGLARDCEGRVKAVAQRKADSEYLRMHAAWRMSLAAAPESRENARDTRWVDPAPLAIVSASR